MKKARKFKPTIDPLLNDFGVWLGAVTDDPQRTDSQLTVSQVQSLMWEAALWGYRQGHADASDAQEMRVLKLEGSERAEVPWKTVPHGWEISHGKMSDS